MKALLFFSILFSIIYSIIQHVSNIERRRRVEHIEEVPTRMMRANRSVAVPKNHDDEAAGLLLLTDNLTNNNDD